MLACEEATQKTLQVALSAQVQAPWNGGSSAWKMGLLFSLRDLGAGLRVTLAELRNLEKHHEVALVAPSQDFFVRVVGGFVREQNETVGLDHAEAESSGRWLLRLAKKADFRKHQ